ncbi:MAG: porin family protein [Flavisolibacter sp.]
MRKQSIVLVTFLVLVSGPKILAQKGVAFGLKAGISIPNLTSGNSADPISNGYSSRVGFDGAVDMEWQLSAHFSLQPQLEYSQQGGKKNGLQAFSVPADMVADFPPGQLPPYLYADYKDVAKFNYLMLPVLAKYHFGSSSRWQPYISAGPFVSYLLSARNVTTGSSNIYLDAQKTQSLTPGPQSFDQTDDVRTDLHPWNAGISGHVGVEHPLGTGKIFLEAGGNYGLIDIQKDKTNGKNKTGAAVLNAGYRFRSCPHKKPSTPQP